MCDVPHSNVSVIQPKNIKEAMADSAWIESMQEELHQFDRLDHEVLHLDRHGLEAATSGKPASIGFRSCTSRSRYWSVSKQTTRIAPSFISFFPVDTSLIHIESRKSPTKSLFDVGSRRISIFTVNTKEYHSDVLAIYTRILR
ncbi:hypothetical protein Tco_0892198 [Tanacetum coccineum]|uniref:Gag-Pol polyprotein n=1 Tax=Tanacetum coccineum TaxID=301880 RepID=A0ABQ5C8E7_9ASTR